MRYSLALAGILIAGLALSGCTEETSRAWKEAEVEAKAQSSSRANQEINMGKIDTIDAPAYSILYRRCVGTTAIYFMTQRWSNSAATVTEDPSCSGGKVGEWVSDARLDSPLGVAASSVRRCLGTSGLYILDGRSLAAIPHDPNCKEG